MSDKQQSAVDFLVDEIQSLLDSGFLFHPENEYEIINKAKELFKQQSEFMFECGRNFQMTADGTFNEVYNETFKTESNGTT